MKIICLRTNVTTTRHRNGAEGFFSPTTQCCTTTISPMVQDVPPASNFFSWYVLRLLIAFPTSSDTRYTYASQPTVLHLSKIPARENPFNQLFSKYRNTTENTGYLARLQKPMAIMVNRLFWLTSLDRRHPSHRHSIAP
jgi:hypothetical protein